jgi:hypothetical protein
MVAVRDKCRNLIESGYLMNRRDFLGSTLASLTLVAGGVTVALGGSSNRETANYIFYDERFQTAERLAKQIAGSAEAIPVRGDVTAVWNGALKSASQGSPLVLAGVTTESFYFCLKTLMQSNARLELSTRRINQDLFVWSIQTYQQIGYRAV